MICAGRNGRSGRRGIALKLQALCGAAAAAPAGDRPTNLKRRGAVFDNYVSKAEAGGCRLTRPRRLRTFQPFVRAVAGKSRPARRSGE